MREYDLIIIGGGPGGYALAAREAAAGRRVVLFERDRPGGTCLNRGCIPTKCLCASAHTVDIVAQSATMGVDVPSYTIDYGAMTARRDSVVDGLRSNIQAMLSDVQVVKSTASLNSEGHVVDTAGMEYSAPRIVIATGSKPAMLPIPGAELAITSDEVLQMSTLPTSMCIIGAGVIGMEFASIYATLGVNVTVVEYAPEILPPIDPEIAKRLRSMLSRRGVKFVVGAAVTSISEENAVKVVHYTDKRGKEAMVESEMVLMAVGRRPVLPDGLAEAGVRLTPRGFIEVDSRTMSTSAPGIYAVGDVNGLCMLAHAAEAQALVAVGEEVDLQVIPSVVFTHPEIATVGPTPAQCEAQGIAYASAKAMYGGNGKAQADGTPEGFIKVLYDSETRRLIACSIIGAHASDLISEAALAIHAGMTIDDIAHRVVHGHPTLSEILKTACTV